MRTTYQKPYAKGSVIAALDIGSSKIACFIARVIDDHNSLQLVGIGHQASSGVKGGSIVDIHAAEAAIRQTVHAAENMAADVLQGYPLRDVVVALPGVHSRSHLMQVEIQIYGHEVTDNDVQRALYKAHDFTASDTQELLHIIPTHYRIDGQDGIREPRGMFGQILEVGTHAVTAERSALNNQALCIERSYLDVRSVCAAPYASGLSALVDDEMDLGCTVIDMGGGQTSFAVFYGGAVVCIGSVPLGGQHVTSDIARGLNTNLKAAERLKNLYGSALATASDDGELIDVPPLGEEDPQTPNHVPRSLLIGIIQPRVEEILELVRRQMADLGVDDIAGRRAVLTGGACQLPGLRDLAQSVLQKQVRIGRPLRLSGLADAVSGPGFTVAAGLLRYITTRQQDIPANILRLAHQGSLMSRIKHWLKENW